MSGHAGHLLLLLIWLGALVGWELRAGRVPRAVLLAVSATAVSGGVHLMVVPEHVEESAVYGGFFLLVGLAQLAWCWAYLRRPSAPLLGLGGLASAAVVLLWAETRFVGAGFGPLAAGTEAISWHDVLATGTELVLVAAAVSSLWSKRRAARGAALSEASRPDVRTRPAHRAAPARS